MPPAKSFLGEFEQMVLLAILQCSEDAFALEVREEIERSAGKKVSRGAFYTTIDRLTEKGFVRWKEALPQGARGSARLRRYEVTAKGLQALRSSRFALMKLSRGLDDLLEGA
jgi:PadR family transcriptional regulator, regulatory protein PadR